MKKLSGLASKLDALAERILDEVAEDHDATHDQKIEALKVVGAYHLGMTKLSGKSGGDDDSGGPSFRDWSARVKQEGKASDA